MARLTASASGDARVKVEKDLARVQEAPVAVEEGRHKVEKDLSRVQEALAVEEEGKRKEEAEIARLEVERTSLLLEIGATKDKVSSLHSQASKDKEAMEEEYQKALEVIFSYGYGCCVFKHNIYGDHLKVPDGMPDSADPLPLEFFVNPRLPPLPQRLKFL